MSRVAVIGAGISGIASAFYLKKEGFFVDLYESASKIGGRIGSEFLQGRWIDFGGKNIGRHYLRFRAFVREMGSFPFEYFGFNTSQLIGGKLVRLTKEDRKVPNLVTFMKLVGIPGIARLYPWVKAVVNEREQGMLNTPFFNDVASRFDRQPLASWFPESCVAHLLRPVTVRMNGAEPDECYPGNFGSNLALVLDSYEQLKGGMHQLLDAFTDRCTGQISIKTGHCVERISSLSPEGEVEVSFRHEGRRSSLRYDQIVTALPAPQLSLLLEPSLPAIARLLKRIRYYPVSVAVVGYRDDVFTKGHRAMVFDEHSALSNAGAYGLNDLNLVRYTFSGRTARAEIMAESNPEEVILQAEQKILPYFSIAENQRTAMMYRYLSPGLCAYSPFHHRLLAELQEALGRFPGLSVTGDFRRGASIEACFAAAAETVQQLVRKTRF